MNVLPQTMSSFVEMKTSENERGERERAPQTASWECEIVDNYLLSKIQCLPDELELSLKTQQPPETKMLERGGGVFFLSFSDCVSGSSLHK